MLVLEDADFGALLAFREAASPSCILFRGLPDRSAATLLSMLLANLAPCRRITIAEGQVTPMDIDLNYIDLNY